VCSNKFPIALAVLCWTVLGANTRILFALWTIERKTQRSRREDAENADGIEYGSTRLRSWRQATQLLFLRELCGLPSANSAFQLPFFREIEITHFLRKEERGGVARRLSGGVGS